MASPVSFPGENVVFTAEGCDDLPTLCMEERITSCWELSPEELEEVKKTGKVWLVVFGKQQPPVSVNGIRPFKISEKKE